MAVGIQVLVLCGDGSVPGGGDCRDEQRGGNKL